MSSNCNLKAPGNPRGFTLIELLIVVAIIAILAAIAVPNFLEAQVRAKTARVRSDMRTMATAIEAYRVDKQPLSTARCNPAGRFHDSFAHAQPHAQPV
jgi:prepilin-type N-terminal cleavage/methylation domain-containing protein